MQKVKKIQKAAKAAPAAKAVAVAVPAKAAKAAPTQASDGIVLKVAFKDLDAEGLKTLRRHLRRALRDKDAPQFRFHKLGTRWVFPTARDVQVAREIRKGVPSLQ
jgi:hypothetical protein